MGDHSSGQPHGLPAELHPLQRRGLFIIVRSPPKQKPTPSGVGLCPARTADVLVSAPARASPMWSLDPSRAMVNNLQVHVTGRKRAISIGADLAVEAKHRTAVVEKNNRRALRPRTTTSRAGRRAGTTPCGGKFHRRRIELQVIDRPITVLDRNATAAYRLFSSGEHTGHGEG